MIALTCTSLADICSLLQLPQYPAYTLEKTEETKNEISLLYLSWSYPILTFHSSKVHTSLWMMNYFPPYNPFSHRQNIASLSPLHHYFHQKCSDKPHSLVPSVQTFTVHTHHAMSTMVKHPNSLGKQEGLFRPLLAKKCYFVEGTPERMLFAVYLLPSHPYNSIQ